MTTMNKKAYQQPTIEAVVLLGKQPLLTSSIIIGDGNKDIFEQDSRLDFDFDFDDSGSDIFSF